MCWAFEEIANKTGEMSSSRHSPTTLKLTIYFLLIHFNLNTLRKHRCKLHSLVFCHKQNNGKQGDAPNVVLPLRVVMQHRRIYHWKNSLRTRFLAVYAVYQFMPIAHSRFSISVPMRIFANLPNAHRPMHVGPTFSCSLKASWFRDFHLHKIN